MLMYGRSTMYEPLMQRVSQDVVVILQNGGERAAVRRAVRMQVATPWAR